MEPETIEIKVAEYYDQPKYYGDMPEAVFNALKRRLFPARKLP